MDDPLESRDIASQFVAGPIVCPFCWDCALERLEGVRLSARPYVEQPSINRVKVYHCSSWYVFAVFEQTM